MMKIGFLVVGVLLLCKTTYAQTEPSKDVWSLKECLEYAVKNSSALKQSGLDRKQARHQVNEVKSSGLPQINGFGNFDYNLELPTQLLPGEILGKPGEELPVQFGQKYNVQGGIQLNQLLFSQSYFIGLKAVRSGEELYRLRQEMTQENVIYNIGVAYYQIMQTFQQLENLQANLEMMEELNRIMQIQYKNDLVRKVDLTRIEVNKTNIETQIQNLEILIVRQKNALKFFMGMPISESIEIETDEIEYEIVAPGLEDITSINKNKIGYRLLETQESLYQLNIKNIQAGYYPSLSAYGQYVIQAQRNETDFFNPDRPWFRSSAIGLRLSIPIFDGQKKRAQAQQARIDMEKLDIDKMDFEKNTQMELDNSINQLENSLASIQTQEQNVQLAEDVYNTTYDLYKEGISPLTDLLEAETTLRTSRTALNNEILKYKIARLDYLNAIGELNGLIK